MRVALLSALLFLAGHSAWAETRYTTSEQTIYLQSDRVSDTQGAGIVFAATAVEILGQNRGTTRVRLSGWREEGADRVIYEIMGQRIQAAALRPGALDRVVSGQPVVDPATDRSWAPVHIDVWVQADALAPERAMLWQRGAEMFTSSCAQCHSEMRPEDYLSNQWIGIMKSMDRYMTLDRPGYRFLQKYLQLHAQDTIGRTQREAGHGR